MPLLSEKDRTYLQNLFSQRLVNPVKLLFFSRKIGCEYCGDVKAILEEVAGLSDKIKLEEHNFEEDKALAEKFGIDKVPGLAILRNTNGEIDYGVRFFGVPSSYEFSALIEAILAVSKGSTDLDQLAKQELSKVNKPVHIQVFTTPTCPYCPRAVVTAHKLAIENKNIRADMIESIEFPDLANKYRVYAVPKVVINDRVEFEGALPDVQFVEKVLEAVEKTE